MTSYHGGKQRIGKQIAEKIHLVSSIIEEEEGFEIKGYCEPFVGMCGVYQHIPDLFEDHKPKLKYKAGDINKSVIMMWKAAQKGWKPPTKCSETKFNKLRDNGNSSAEKGFIGHACTYRGIAFSSYFNKKNVIYSSNKVQETSNILSKVSFKSGKYTQYSNLKGYIIYCDPPYQGKNNWYYDEKNNLLKFDFDSFYDWIEKMSEYNLVFISERAKLPYQKIATYKDQEKLYMV